MKRSLIFILTLFISYVGYCQEPISKDSVIQVPGITAEQIYQRINTWFVSFAKHDSRSLIQLKEDDKKHLVGTFSFAYHDNSLSYLNMEGYITAVFDITARDGRYRVKCSQYSHFSSKKPGDRDFEIGILYAEMPEDTPGMTRRMSYKHLLKKVKPMIESQWQSMLSGMLSAVKTETSVEEDW